MFESNLFRINVKKGILGFQLTEDYSALIDMIKQEPNKGNQYHVTIESMEEAGTKKQNRLYHKLVQIAYRSGCLSYDNTCIEHFKSQIEIEFGGKEAIAYYEIYYTLNGKFKSVSVVNIDEKLKTYKDIIAVKQNVKSWTQINKKTRMKIIDGLINVMLESGVNDKEFGEIVEQLNNKE